MKAGHSDVHMEKVLQALKVTEPDLYCPSNKRISWMCINPHCQTSFFCNQRDCHTCERVHRKCPVVRLSGLTDSLNERVVGYKNFSSKTLQIQRDFIDEIQQARSKLTEQFHLSNLDNSHTGLIKQIYEKKNWKGISGQMAKEFMDGLENEDKQKIERSAKLLDEYKKDLKDLATLVINIQSKLFEEYSQRKEVRMDFDSKIIEIGNERRKEDMQFLRQALNHPRNIELLYRGSENQFRADKFHQKCDNIANTFTLVKTQFGKIIGGFSHYAWNVVFKDYFGHHGRNAFLISFDLRQKMIPNSHQGLIYCHPNYGPTFGEGHDLCLSDNCQQNNESYANFSSTYNNEGIEQYEKNQDSWRAFSGATYGRKFKVVEYEVFRVSYQ